MFYLLDYWNTWERYLGRSETGLHAYVKMTPINNWRWRFPEDNNRVALETLIVRSYGPKSSGPLPTEVEQAMDKNLGVEFANRLRTFDYLSEVTAEQIKSAMEKSNGGGVPFAFVKLHITDPTKHWHWK